MANVNDFVNRLSGGGARANQFKVTVTGGFMGGAASSAMTFLCRTSALPAMTVGEVPVPYRGRTVYVAGDRTYADWTVTVFNDNDWLVRGALESWSSGINNIGSSTAGAQPPSSYYGEGQVQQLDRSENVIRTATIHGLWPTNVAEIALAYETNDVIEEFDCTFRFNYMTLAGEGGALGAG